MIPLLVILVSRLRSRYKAIRSLHDGHSFQCRKTLWGTFDIEGVPILTNKVVMNCHDMADGLRLETSDFKAIFCPIYVTRDSSFC